MSDTIKRWVIVSVDEEIFPMSYKNIPAKFNLFFEFLEWVRTLDTKRFMELSEKGYRAVEKTYREVEE